MANNVYNVHCTLYNTLYIETSTGIVNVGMCSIFVPTTVPGHALPIEHWMSNGTALILRHCDAYTYIICICVQLCSCSSKDISKMIFFCILMPIVGTSKQQSDKRPCDIFTILLHICAPRKGWTHWHATTATMAETCRHFLVHSLEQRVYSICVVYFSSMVWPEKFPFFTFFVVIFIFLFTFSLSSTRSSIVVMAILWLAFAAMKS